jgi:hypothetical protein
MVEIAVLAVAHVVFDAAGGRHQPGGDAVQQRRLAGAGFTDDRQHFARPQLEGDVLAADAVAVEFRDVVDFEKRVSVMGRCLHAVSEYGECWRL